MKVKYKNFTLKSKDPSDYKETKELMARDTSWGTYTQEMDAIKNTLGEGILANCKKLQPTITNSTGKVNDSEFVFSYNEDFFNFEKESIDHFVGTVAGDIILNPKIIDLEVGDFEFDGEHESQYFPGPNLGIEGLYGNLFKDKLSSIERPLVAFTIKPRLGLKPKEIGEIYRKVSDGDIDICEDDERLIDPVFCPFEERVNVVSEVQKGNKTIYSINITGDSADALKKATYCIEKNIKMLKIDVLVSGFETLRKVTSLIKEKAASNIAITVYPDAYGAFRKLSREFILKLSRLCGADIIYAGSPNWSRYSSEEGKLITAIEPILHRHTLLASNIKYASHVKGTLATITNDQHLSRIEAIIATIKKNRNHYKYGFFIGGGISSFPTVNIEQATSYTMNCVKHASTQDMKNYKNYKDLDRFHEQFAKMGWDNLDVKGSI